MDDSFMLSIYSCICLTVQKYQKYLATVDCETVQGKLVWSRLIKELSRCLFLSNHPENLSWVHYVNYLGRSQQYISEALCQTYTKSLASDCF